MSDPVSCTISDGVAVIRLDDGKANAVSPLLIEQLDAALDRAGEEASAVAIIGREGRFSAGFDLSVMQQGPEQAKALIGAGGRLLMRLYTHPQPTVAAVTGHALAAGAFVAMTCDTRIGIAGSPAKIGLNETAIGMTLPWFGVRLGEARLSLRHRQAAILQARIYDHDGAVDAGFLDEVVDADALVDHAIGRARELGSLPAGAYAGTKRRLRQGLADEILAGLDADVDGLTDAVPST